MEKQTESAAGLPASQPIKISDTRQQTLEADSQANPSRRHLVPFCSHPSQPKPSVVIQWPTQTIPLPAATTASSKFSDADLAGTSEVPFMREPPMPPSAKTSPLIIQLKQQIKETKGRVVSRRPHCKKAKKATDPLPQVDEENEDQEEKDSTS
jgi:hypothetical protein